MSDALHIQWVCRREETPMSVALYGLGYLIIVGGVAYLASLMHIPQTWIVAIVVILLGMGLVTVAQNNRGKS